MWAGWDTDWKLGVAILIGYAILVGNRVLHLNPHKPHARLARRLVAAALPGGHGPDRLLQRLRPEG